MDELYDARQEALRADRAYAYGLKGSDNFRRTPFLMSWTYIVLGVAIVVLLLNIGVVIMLRHVGTGLGSNRESQNR